MAGIEIPSGFSTSGNLNENLKALITAQSLGFSAHRSGVKKLMDSLYTTATVNGKLCYQASFNLKGRTCDYTTEESTFLKELIGIDNAGLQEICDVGADNVVFAWKPRSGFTKEDWQHGLQILNDYLADVDTIRVYSTMVNYWTDAEKPNPDYVEGGTEPEFIPLEYADRVPVEFDYNTPTAKTTDGLLSSSIGNSFNDRVGTILLTELPIYRNLTFEMYGDYLPSIVLYDNVGTDITANYDFVILHALVSLLLVNDTNIMTETTALTKSGETTDIADESIYVTAYKEWSANISASFIEDVLDTNYHAYTYDIGGGERFFDVETDYVFANHFWKFRDDKNTVDNIEVITDGLFTTNGDNIYLVIERFQKITYQEYGRWIFGLAFVDAWNDGGCCGIGGILGDLLGGIVTLVGSIVGEIIDVFSTIATLTLKVTGLYHMLKYVGLSNKDLELIAEILAHVALAVVTIGVGEYISLASTASAQLTAQSALQVGVYSGGTVGAEITTSQVATAIGTKLAEAGTVNLGVKAIGTGYSAKQSIDEKYKEKSEPIDKMEDEALDNSSMAKDNKERVKLKYNPFARMEINEMNKYDSFNSYKRKNPYRRVQN